jgi:hypothetical protein
MTTPPTPAGWYPDPDGSGGQRYWDGSTWAERPSPGTHSAPEPGEQPTAVVQTRPADGSGGAHRAPEPDAQPEPEPQPQPTPPSDQTTAPVLTERPAHAEPSASEPPEPRTADANRQLIIKFGAVCAALLAVLVVVLIYAFVIHKDNTVQIGASGDKTASTSASPTTSASKTQTQTHSESPTAPAGSGQATDSGITFAVDSVENAPTVTYQDASVEKSAQGEYVVVHMTVLNSGDAPATFLGTLQKLKAGGTTYPIDDEATFYLNGGLAELNPGDQADVGLAFDVPPGTVPETLEVHGDPVSPGVDLPLS